MQNQQFQGDAGPAHRRFKGHILSKIENKTMAVVEMNKEGKLRKHMLEVKPAMTEALAHKKIIWLLKKAMMLIFKICLVFAYYENELSMVVHGFCLLQRSLYSVKYFRIYFSEFSEKCFYSEKKIIHSVKIFCIL